MFELNMLLLKCYSAFKLILIATVSRVVRIYRGFMSPSTITGGVIDDCGVLVELIEATLSDEEQ